MGQERSLYAKDHDVPPTDQPSDERVVVLPAGSPRAIEWAAERLATGGVIALPTDTVYGIASSLNDATAIRRLATIKGRPEDKPIPVLISSAAIVEHLTSDLPADLSLLLEELWPGPLTMVLPAKAGMPVEVTGGTGTVGLRMPNHPLALEVIEKSGGAIACTSANLAGEPPSLTAHEVSAALGTKLDLILDGGRAPGGVASTVVAYENGGFRLLREGTVALATIEASWANLRAGRG